jgi:hypothetical protein
MPTIRQVEEWKNRYSALLEEKNAREKVFEEKSNEFVLTIRAKDEELERGKERELARAKEREADQEKLSELQSRLDNADAEKVFLGFLSHS